MLLNQKDLRKTIVSYWPPAARLRMSLAFVMVPAVACALFAAVTLMAQAPSITVDAPYAGDRNVTGKAEPASGPLTAYEVVGSTRNFLGRSSSIDQQGFYAIAVNPPLASGQKVIVADAQNRISATVSVTTKSGPAGPSN